MRVLLVNKFHYLKGGSEKYYFELAKLLEEKGCEVAFFSMYDEKNIKTNNKEYFVEKMDLNSNNKLKAFDVIYSKENKKKMKVALEEFKPDIVHLNNFQRQLSASIIDAINEKNIPTVYTAHDIQSICPAILMLDNNKNICEKCLNGKYMNCIKNKCVKDSTLKSLLGAIEGQYYRSKKIYTKKIDKIITPSEFYKSKMINDGIEEEKIVMMHNFIDIEEYDLQIEDDGYAFYLGRLSREKGILNLIQAISKIEQGELYIAGEGPEREKIEKFIKDNKLEKRIKLIGFLDQKQVKEYIRKSRFVVAPSIWYENCPYSIIEALAIGKPVLGANIAGIPELVKDNINGFLYKYDDINELAEKMKALFVNKEKVKLLGETAKKQARNLYSKELYYQQVIKLYRKLLKEE